MFWTELHFYYIIIIGSNWLWGFGFPQSHFCCHLLEKRWTHILPQPKIIQAKTRCHRKADAISAAETNSVHPEGRKECRGKCPLGVEATMARSGAFSDSPQHLQPVALRISCQRIAFPSLFSFSSLFVCWVCLAVSTLWKVYLGSKITLLRFPRSVI